MFLDLENDKPPKNVSFEGVGVGVVWNEVETTRGGK